MKIVLVCGARPNFMKIAPLIRAIAKHNKLNKLNEHNKLNEPNKLPITPILVHTGQHYDYEMSQVFFQDLELPKPDIYLGVGSGSHAEQTGKVMIELEKALLKERPDLVVVVGDVNSTLAAALAAVKLLVPVAHVEAGLRSYDRTMPEETNRLLTDQISDYLFTPSRDADENLKKEGIPPEKIFFVGNVMVDSLLHSKPLAERSDILERLGLLTAKPNELNQRNKLNQLKQPNKLNELKELVVPYALLTLHRPSNVDDKYSLTNIMNAITEISARIPVVFAAHPRTQKKLREFNLNLPASVITSPDELNKPNKLNEPSRLNKLNELNELKEHDKRLLIIPPLSYLDFLKLEMYARLVMTDSGGIQEETTVLGVPCLTLRETTERPVTVTHGTNVVVGKIPDKIMEEASRILASESLPSSDEPNELKKLNEPNKLPSPPLWDGKAADRIVDVLASKRLLERT
jgi:UDP-N-acetylglucosamine 2-epimerase (non-hydrolysing)